MRFVIFFFIISIIGCSNRQAETDSTDLENRLIELQAKVEKVERDNQMAQLTASFENVAFLEIGKTSFQTLKSPIGVLTFSIDDIKPFANGSKVKISIGNPHNASLDGISFKVDYGELTENKTINEKLQKTKEISITDKISGGYWNTKEIILEGLSDEKLGYVRIYDLDAGSMYLKREF